MINNVPICVFDTETLGLMPSQSDIIQVACLIIEPRSLEIVENSEFNSLMRPINVLEGTSEEIELKWSKAAEALSKNGKKRDELEKAPLSKLVWKEFTDHILSYSVRGRKGDKWSRPISSGHNTTNFDLKFVDRYCKMFGPKDNEGYEALFNARPGLDTSVISMLWWENRAFPEKYNMDYLREYLGVPKTEETQAHDALGDVRLSAEFLIRFLKLHRRYTTRVNFQGSFSK